MKEALAWYKYAAKNGDQEAIQVLEMLEWLKAEENKNKSWSK
jgi:TPR repeat protein